MSAYCGQWEPSDIEHTGHVKAMGEEIRGIGNQDNETALNLGEAPDIGELQEQGGTNADNDANHQATKEDEQEDSGSFEKAKNPMALPRGVLLILLRRLKDDNGNGIVQH